MSEIQVGDVVKWRNMSGEWKVLVIDGDRAGIKRLDAEIWDWARIRYLTKVEPMISIEISVKTAQFMKSGTWSTFYNIEIATACRKVLEEGSEG